MAGDGTVRIMSAQPHVFVVPGSVTNLAGDAWLLPTDRTIDVTEGWRKAVPTLDEALAHLGPEADDFRTERVKALVLPGWPEDEPQPVLVPVPYEGVRDAGQIDEPLAEALRAAARAAHSRSRRRALPLVGMPMFGTAGGGGDPLRGEVLRHILAVAEAVAREEVVDVALVLREPADLAQAHALRRHGSGSTWSELGEHLIHRARVLAGKARAGQLVPFIGAGVSVSAGLPTWGRLLSLLLAESELPRAEHAGFEALDALDQAHILRGLYPGGNTAFNHAVARHTDRSRYGLAPALLAGLPTTEAVTLNYDTLYERASRDGRRELAVLPEQAARPGQRWILKLHGTVKHPETIVLTREDYLGYGRGREALSALAKAMLLTRHLLFVGFGLADDHFHELMHDVRAVLPKEVRGEGKLGTALLLEPDPLRTRLWGDDLDLLAIGGADRQSQGRRLEVFLDCMLAHADQGLPFFLDDRYRHRLTEAELRLRRRLHHLAVEADEDERRTPAWAEVAALLRSLGHQP